jgi:hypothetical protein
MTTSILAALERAELEARARRLAAQTTADSRLADARAAAAAILATRDDEVRSALAALRSRCEQDAAAAVAAANAELARLAPGSEPREAQPAFEDAVEALVAAVLGESEA